MTPAEILDELIAGLERLVAPVDDLDHDWLRCDEGGPDGCALCLGDNVLRLAKAAALERLRAQLTGEAA